MGTASGGTQGGSCGGGEPAANHSIVTFDNAAPGTCNCRSAAQADSPGATCARAGREDNVAASATANQSILICLLPSSPSRAEAFLNHLASGGLITACTLASFRLARVTIMTPVSTTLGTGLFCR